MRELLYGETKSQFTEILARCGVGVAVFGCSLARASQRAELSAAGRKGDRRDAAGGSGRLHEPNCRRVVSALCHQLASLYAAVLPDRRKNSRSAIHLRSDKRIWLAGHVSVFELPAVGHRDDR